jgi:hypothetical protein
MRLITRNQIIGLSFIFFLVTLYLILPLIDGVDEQEINTGDGLSVTNFYFLFKLRAEKIVSPEDNKLKILFEFSTPAMQEDIDKVSFELILFMVRQDSERWSEGTSVQYSNPALNNVYFVIGRKDGPSWGCNTQVLVFAEIICNLDDSIIFIVEETINIICVW